MNIVIRDKSNVMFVAWAYDNKPSGGVICVKTKDRTVYFPLAPKPVSPYPEWELRHKLKAKHKGKEYVLPCMFYL